MNFNKTKIASVVSGLGVMATQAQAAVPEAASTALATALADALAGIALGGAAYLTFRSAGVIWSLIANFVGRMRRA